MSDRKGLGCGSAILLITVLGFVTYCALRDPPTPEEVAAEQQATERRQARAAEKRAAERAVTDEYGSRGMAIDLAKNAITKLLKSPSTAKFPSWFKIKHQRGEGEYVHSVAGWVDAQNSFGAMIRTNWLVQFEYTPPDDWRIIHLDFGGETVVAAPRAGPRSSRVPEAAAPSTAFETFKITFTELNLRVYAKGGVVLFTSTVSDLGNGIVQVNATDTWMTGSYEERYSNLDTIYNLWQAAQQGVHPPLAVWVSHDGVTVMRKPEPAKEPMPTASPAFETFETGLAEVTRIIRAPRESTRWGAALFADAINKGNGVVHVNVTEAWTEMTLVERRASLDMLYAMWGAAQQADRHAPLAVWIRDPDGRIVMRKP